MATLLFKEMGMGHSSGGNLSIDSRRGLYRLEASAPEERASDLSAPWGEGEVATLLLKERGMWAL